MPLHLLAYRSLPVLVIILFNFCLFMELNFRDSTFVDLNYYFLFFDVSSSFTAVGFNYNTRLQFL